MPEESYCDINARVIGSWVEDGWEWGKPIDHEEFVRAKQGDWQIRLTPTKPVPQSWWPPLHGAEVLGLASGGGQQMPILTAAGAYCTVLDYTPAQLESERMVAQREGYHINVVCADMTRMLPFDDEAFDVVVNPVSLCYVRKVEPVFCEIARVLRPGGALLAGFDTGLNYVVDTAEERIVRGLPYDPIANPQLLEEGNVDEEGVQFSHTAAELLRAMIRAGFIIDDLFEDVNGEGRLSELGIPTMMAVRAHKPGVMWA